MLPHMTGFLTRDGEDAAEAVLECNRRTEECGLSLSASEARILCRTRSEALSREGRRTGVWICSGACPLMGI